METSTSGTQLLLAIPCGLAAGFLFELCLHTGRYFNGWREPNSYVAAIRAMQTLDIRIMLHGLTALIAFAVFLLLPLFPRRPVSLLRVLPITLPLLWGGGIVGRFLAPRVHRLWDRQAIANSTPFYRFSDYPEKYGMVLGFCIAAFFIVTVVRSLNVPRLHLWIRLGFAGLNAVIIGFFLASAITDGTPFNHGNFRREGLWPKAWQSAFLFVWIAAAQVMADEVIRYLRERQAKRAAD